MANVVGGIGVVYLIGIPVQAWLTGTSSVVATAVAAIVFLPGDIAKAIVATLVAAGVHRGHPVPPPARRRAPAGRDLVRRPWSRHRSLTSCSTGSGGGWTVGCTPRSRCSTPGGRRRCAGVRWTT